MLGRASKQAVELQQLYQSLSCLFITSATSHSQLWQRPYYIPRSLWSRQRSQEHGSWTQLHPKELLNSSHYLLHRLHQFLTWVWTSGHLPQQWKDAKIIMLCKHKSDKAECSDSYGISLLLVAHVMLYYLCLFSNTVDIVMSGSQCGFHHGHSTIDMTFVTKLQQERCWEQHRYLYFTFIYLTKAFNAIIQ